MVYTIKKGNHYNFHLPRFHFGKRNIFFKFKLDSSCSYLILDNDRFDINKIYGIGWGNHLSNSFRIGYNCISKDRFQIYAFWHNYGLIHFKPLITCTINQWVTCNISFLYDESRILGYVGKEPIKEDMEDLGEIGNIDINFVYPDIKWGYWLYPYFGGNKTALHDTKIEIKNL